jgi:hypothetical protein
VLVKIPKKNNLKEERFIWLTVSKVSVHGHLVPWKWAWSEAEYYDGSAW